MCVHIKERKHAYRILIGKLEGKGCLEDRRRWEGNIKMHLKEIDWGVGWINFTKNTDQ
jgi:hypothetical protein